MAAPASLADRVKQRADMVAVAGQYTRLRRAGRQFVGLCPFHKERHASFFVHPQKKVFHCFGCGVGGDVFALVMRGEHCDFCSALNIVQGFSLGVARGSEPRSGERFGAREGASPQPAKRAASYSPKQESSRKFHDAWRGPCSTDLARACEPETLSEPRPFYLVRHE
jgi:DNA primase